MKKHIVALASILICTISMLTGYVLSDSIEYSGYIQEMYEIGVIPGDETGELNPDRVITPS